MDPKLSVDFDNFAKDPASVLERVRVTPVNSTTGVLWGELLGPTGGWNARGRQFLMDWDHVDESILSEMKNHLQKTLVGFDSAVSEKYPAEIERLRQLAK
jgi:hypothetical protein